MITEQLIHQLQAQFRGICETMEALTESLPDHVEKPARNDVAIIQRTIAKHFKIPEDFAQSYKRTSDLIIPRQISIYISWKMTACSLTEAAKSCRHDMRHGNAKYSIKKVEDRISTEPRYAALVNFLITECETAIASQEKSA